MARDVICAHGEAHENGLARDYPIVCPTDTLRIATIGGFLVHLRECQEQELVL
jgi:hypothetical protein